MTIDNESIQTTIRMINYFQEAVERYEQALAKFGPSAELTRGMQHEQSMLTSAQKSYEAQVCALINKTMGWL